MWKNVLPFYHEPLRLDRRKAFVSKLPARVIALRIASTRQVVPQTADKHGASQRSTRPASNLKPR